jgi:hypothetical protein
MYAAVPRIMPIWVMAGVVIVVDIESDEAFAAAEVGGSESFANPK